MSETSRNQEPLVQMRDIRKSFFGTEVLKGIDLDLRPGKIHGLIGHNGAGKSTLIKILAGVYSKDSGEVVVGGRPVVFTTPAESIDAGIGVIHQEFALVPEFTAAQNLLLGREPKLTAGFIDHRGLQRNAEQALKSYGFDIPRSRPVRELSVAHQQLTEIAKALYLDAQVLIMDEPTSRLAPAEREQLFSVVRDLTAKGVAVVYISHFLEEVLEICDEVTVLRDGEVVAHRPASDFNLESLSAEIVGEVAEAIEDTAEQLDERGPDAVGTEGHKIGDAAGAAPVDRQDEPVLVLKDFAPEGRPAIDLELRRGEVIGLAGLVGSGRTEILEAMAGARGSSGTMTLNGKRVLPGNTAEGINAGIALVPEDRKNKGLVMERGIADNVVLSSLSKLLSKLGFVNFKARKDHYEDGISRFRISAADPNGPTRTLSGGNQQKVLLARASGIDPTILLLDQPTAGVDIGAKAEIYSHIGGIIKSGSSCVVASDEMEELLLLCDRIAVIREGKVAMIRSASNFDEHTLLAEMSRTDSEPAVL